MSFLEEHRDGLLLRLHIQPGAARAGIKGVRLEQIGDRQVERLRIAISAKAVKGAANDALIEFLADLCDCPKSDIHLTAGETNRSKTVLVKNAGAGLVEKLRGLGDSLR